MGDLTVLPGVYSHISLWQTDGRTDRRSRSNCRAWLRCAAKNWRDRSLSSQQTTWRQTTDSITSKVIFTERSRWIISGKQPGSLRKQEFSCCTIRILADECGVRSLIPKQILWTTRRQYAFKYNHWYAIGPVKLPNSVKQRRITAITPFKVIEGHWFWYQSKARMRLPISEW